MSYQCLRQVQMRHEGHFCCHFSNLSELPSATRLLIQRTQSAFVAPGLCAELHLNYSRGNPFFPVTLLTKIQYSLSKRLSKGSTILWLPSKANLASELTESMCRV